MGSAGFGEGGRDMRDRGMGRYEDMYNNPEMMQMMEEMQNATSTQ
jgi:hypothetical protein